MFGLWIKPQTNGFHEIVLLFSILLQLDRLQLTAVSATDGWCKDNTSKDPFSQCENLQNLQGVNSRTGEKRICGTLTTSELMTRMQSDKHNNMFNVAAKPEACRNPRAHQLKTSERCVLNHS